MILTKPKQMAKGRIPCAKKHWFHRCSGWLWFIITVYLVFLSCVFFCFQVMSTQSFLGIIISKLQSFSVRNASGSLEPVSFFLSSFLDFWTKLFSHVLPCNHAKSCWVKACVSWLLKGLSSCAAPSGLNVAVSKDRLEVHNSQYLEVLLQNSDFWFLLIINGKNTSYKCYLVSANELLNM